VILLRHEPRMLCWAATSMTICEIRAESILSFPVKCGFRLGALKDSQYSIESDRDRLEAPLRPMRGLERHQGDTDIFALAA
jgi:hypothetical protein